MKTTIKLILALSLFGSIALADGNQGNGGSPVLIETKPPAVMTVVISVVNQYLGFGY